MDKQSSKIKAELIKSINFLRKCDDKKYVEEIYTAIKTSPEYQKVKEKKKEIIEKKDMVKQGEEQFVAMEKDAIEKLKAYVKNQEKYIKKINQLLEKDDRDTLKKTVSEASAI